MKLFIYPPQSVSVAVPPIEFIKNGVDTSVSRDTATPANSNPLPTINLDGSGAVVNPLTDAQLRATAVPVSGPLTDAELRASAVPVSGPLTDAQLRASAVPVSASSLPLPTGAATEATLSALNSKVSSYDLDSGAGTENVQGVSLRKSASGGSVELGTAADPVRVDPTGSTTQPVSAASLPLPSGAATEATLAALEAKFGSLGQKLMAGSTPVTIASDQSALPVSGPLTDAQLRATAVPVSGPLTNSELRASAIEVTSTPSVQAGTITSGQVSVGTTAVRATVSGSAPNAARKKLMIKPSKNNSGAIYIGASGVTTSNGLEIIGPDRLEFEMDSADYYLISDTASQVVEILEKV